MIPLIERLRQTSLLFAWQVLGVYTPPDRDLLENSFFPHYRDDPAIRRILFVGVGYHLRHYPKLLAGKELATLDSNPAKQRYGSDRHVVDDLARLGQHFTEDWFDLIILNGVLGWGVGVDEADDVMAVCCRHLAPGGRLLLGYNEARPGTPDPDALPSLQKLKAANLPGMQVDRWVVPIPFKEQTHTYRGYQKP